MQAEIKKFLHEEKGLGEIKAVRVNRYGVRGSVGKREAPLQIEKNVNYDLWLGPALDQPLYRNRLHYDWHWDWNTGSGEMGNWGVHILDDVRNNIFQDSVTTPKQIFGGGGRVLWNDAADSPNVHFVHFDTGPSGYVAFCENGRFEGQRGKAIAFDREGNVVREFKGEGGKLHQQNFIDAIRANDASILNADVQVGHDSTGWCNFANIAYQCGSNFKLADLETVKQSTWRDLTTLMGEHIGTRGLAIDDQSLKLSPVLKLNDEGQFVGDHAEKANGFLKREYREGYEVPEIALAAEPAK